MTEQLRSTVNIPRHILLNFLLLNQRYIYMVFYKKKLAACLSTQRPGNIKA